MIRNTGAAFGGDPNGATAWRPPHWDCVLCFWLFYIINLYGYSLYIPYIFHIYFLDMFHCHPCIFPCVFLNLWSHEKISPYRKTTEIFFFKDFTPFICLLTIFYFSLRLMILKTKSYLLGLGESLGGSRGNPGGRRAVQPLKKLYKNPLEIPKGIPS